MRTALAVEDTSREVSEYPALASRALLPGPGWMLLLLPEFEEDRAPSLLGSPLGALVLPAAWPPGACCPPVNPQSRKFALARLHHLLTRTLHLLSLVGTEQATNMSAAKSFTNPSLPSYSRSFSWAACLLVSPGFSGLWKMTGGPPSQPMTVHGDPRTLASTVKHRLPSSDWLQTNCPGTIDCCHLDPHFADKKTVCFEPLFASNHARLLERS